MIRHDDNYYRQRKPQPDLGPIENFKRLIWDPDRRAFFDRTIDEWASVALFYVCFFGALFSFMGVQLWITYKYVTTFDKPVFQYDRISSREWMEPSQRTTFGLSSLNLHGPGIVLKPNIIPDSQPPLILIDESNEYGKANKYINAIEEMLAEYMIDRTNFEQTCDDTTSRDQNSNKSCYFDYKDLGACALAPYGYDWPPQPCVYMKFNKRFGWQPVAYNHGSYLPNSMPQWLQDFVQKSNKYKVWMSCEGVLEEDSNKLGVIEYLPTPGFDVKYFPFNGQDNYLAPIVALRFKNLTINHVVNVECKTWAHNINNKNRHNLQFRILIKEP